MNFDWYLFLFQVGQWLLVIIGIYFISCGVIANIVYVIPRMKHIWLQQKINNYNKEEELMTIESKIKKLRGK